MKKFSLFMLMAVGLLISGNLRAEKTLVATMTALEQTTSFYMDEAADVPNHVYASAYDALTAALAALPDNSTPATIKLFSNVEFEFGTNFFTVGENRNVTLDLNGKRINATTGKDGLTYLILINGTLTIDDTSEDKNGIISNCPYNADKSEMPGYGSYTILNMGTLILNNGTIENGSSGAGGGACYCVENQSNSGKNQSTFIMNGGKLLQSQSAAMRLSTWNGGAGPFNITINGGIIDAKGYLFSLHIGHKSNVTVNFTINDGEFKTQRTDYCALWNYGKDCRDDMHLEINGGKFYSPGTIYFYGTEDEKPYDFKVNGGEFVRAPFSGDLPYGFITGGTFCNFNTDIIDMYLDLGIYYYVDGGYYEKQKGTEGYPIEDYATEEGMKNLLSKYSVKDYHDCDNESEVGIYWAIFDENSVFLEKVKRQGQETAEQFLENRVKVVDYDKISPGYGEKIYWTIGVLEGSSSEYLDFKSNKDGFIAEGYAAVECTDEGFNPETDLKIDVVKKETKPVTEDIDLNDLNPTNLTDLTIENQGTEDKTTIIVQQNTTVEVEKLTVKNSSEYGEAQIVVSTGATLKLGNGGLVSENDEITTVLVEPGGTFIIGTAGVTGDGDATPIEVKANKDNGSGVVIFNPNSKDEATQRYAEVDLYTYCKKVNDKYYWQQFAIPVTGLDNDKVVKNPEKTSYVFAWDYPTYSWTQLSRWDQLDEPFAGYDMTNVSENGGVVYTFKGGLIGNQNKQLTLPHKDYCVMGNSYTAPIDIEALFEQINKEMSANTIEKTVYKYDAKVGYYVYTNELEQTLTKLGIMNASFTDIKPMEGFLLNLQSGNTAGVMLNYANAVFNPAMDKATGAKAPRQNNSTDLVVANINVMSAHSADRMTLVEGDEFSADIENGKDAFKYLNEGANLYAFDGTNKLAMVATDNLEGTMLAFQAAEDAEYTLTFDRALNTEYVLVDMMNGNEVAMTEGNTYTFFATPNTLDPARFMVKANAQAPTNMKSTKATKVAKGIYTITGQYLGESNQWNAMPQGVYMVNGVKVIK